MSSEVQTMFPDLQSSYSRVSLEKQADDDSSDDGSSQTQGLLGTYHKKVQRRFTTRVVLGTAIFVCIISHAAIFWLGLRLHPDLDRQCLEHTSAYCKLPINQGI